MQRDKAALQYRGKTQLDRAFELACPHVTQVFVSVRAGQTADPTRARRPLIVDSVAGEGPIVGIRSALAAHPHAAWLVLACDLPFLSDAALVAAAARARRELAWPRRSAAPTTACRSRCAPFGSRRPRRARRLSGRRRELPAQIPDASCRAACSTRSTSARSTTSTRPRNMRRLAQRWAPPSSTISCN